ncbi:hypothetical protein NMY22_g11386 [Coprinellus aureogranulatus]|nr:hypothetical protein NMY22_g11386 [Coprinellus aureogranulatus]
MQINSIFVMLSTIAVSTSLASPLTPRTAAFEERQNVDWNTVPYDLGGVNCTDDRILPKDKEAIAGGFDPRRCQSTDLPNAYKRRLMGNSIYSSLSDLTTRLPQTTNSRSSVMSNPSTQPNAHAIQLGLAPEDARASRIFAEFIPYLLIPDPNIPSQVSKAASTMFKTTDTWTFVPRRTVAGDLTIYSGTWTRRHTGDKDGELVFSSTLSTDGSAVIVQRVMNGDGARILQKYFDVARVELGEYGGRRERALRMLKTLPYWVEGRESGRSTCDIGYSIFAQEMPFEFLGEYGNRWHGQLKCSSSWNASRGEDYNSPHANTDLQLCHFPGVRFPVSEFFVGIMPIQPSLFPTIQLFELMILPARRPVKIQADEEMSPGAV